MRMRRMRKDSYQEQLDDRKWRLVDLTGGKARPGIRCLAVAALFALSPAGGTLAASLVPASSTPAQGHAEVIAQGVAELDNGNLVWQVSQESAPTKAKRVNPAAPGFVLPMAGDILLVDSGDADMTRLAVGEAAFVRKGERQTRQTQQPKSTDYYLIEVLKESDGMNDDASYHSKPFASLQGLRDFNLVRDVLEADGETTIPDSDAPVLILVTDGQVEVKEKGRKDALSLIKGQAETFESEITLSSSDQIGGTFVAAVVGPEVMLPQSQPSQSPTPQPTSATVDNESSSETPDSAPVDGDSDGLEDALEPGYGIDPTLWDSDGDELFDGDEVYQFGTDPANLDSDFDGLIDGHEVFKYFTDPNNPDSDSDGVNDSDETNTYAGWDPNNPDMDADGLIDGEELTLGTNALELDSDYYGLTDGQEVLNYGTDPVNPDSDSDGINDSDEINTYVGLDPNNPDSDGDGLIDGEEFTTYGSSPTMADTDGDGFDDGAEVSAGTSPSDATIHP